MMKLQLANVLVICVTGSRQQYPHTQHDIHKDLAEVWTVVRRQG